MNSQTISLLQRPPVRSRAIRKSLPARPVQDVVELPRQSESAPDTPLNSCADQSRRRETKPETSSNLYTHTAQIPPESSQVDPAAGTLWVPTSRQSSATLGESRSLVHSPSLTNEALRKADLFGDLVLSGFNSLFNPNRSLAQDPLIFPSPVLIQTARHCSRYNPSVLEQAELTRKAHILTLPERRNPNLVVSRGHEELIPPLKKIYRDDIDLFLFVFARWAFKVDADAETGNRMYDILSKFQTQLDFMERNPVPPPVSHAAQNGLDIGRMIARRASQTQREWLIPAVSHMFFTCHQQAEQTLNVMDEEEYAAYKEWGPGSWMDAQLREKFFFEHAFRSLEKYNVDEIERRLGGAAGRGVSASTVVDRGDSRDNREGRLLTWDEIHETGDYMELLFLKTGGCGSFQL
ncbi:hypothetical protein ONS95_009111 [Cadophora gregata]|uniref:uncharacterized protein n=1 Tax=Cadophora gregata TaxID=51156 RepID=UPI0026DD0F0E|nr:uncharacterized protein ONS95_009111 [Cadophora gregata]KAK0124128.1 hypothetical protein ONS95_009111 [Cadophora gregata]KAK0130457.1 hypothetical protein ONS96_000976 [Cadophora gregata f. sp. sojae]